MLERDEFVRLSEPVDGVAVSLYLPTHRAGRDTRENPIRYKNLVQEAERRLEAQGWQEDRVKEFLAPLYARVDDYDFWQHQESGLAVFYAEGREPEFVRSPLAPRELTVLSHRYHLVPLMPALTGVGDFYLLSMTLDEACLYRANEEDLERIELPEDTPKSLDEATRFDEMVGATREHGGNAPHGTRNVAAPGTGMAHGTGDSDRDEKMDIARWFAWLDNGVRERIAGSNAPLVFAGLDYLHGIYKEANHYPHFAEVHVSGNPGALRLEELHERARDAMRSHFDKPRQRAIERFADLSGTDQAEYDLDRIVPAAIDGRVDTLFVDVGTHRWGAFDERNRSVKALSEASVDSEDLMDTAAVHTLRNGGTVFATSNREGEIPSGREVAAILRY